MPSQRLYDQLYSSYDFVEAVQRNGDGSLSTDILVNPDERALLQAQGVQFVRTLETDAATERRVDERVAAEAREALAQNLAETGSASPAAAARARSRARRGHDPARVHVHELRGPLPLRRGAHEGRHAGDPERRRGQPGHGAQLRRRRRRVRRRFEHADLPRQHDRHQQQQRLHVPPPPGARDERRAQARARRVERRRRRRGAGRRVGGHDAPAARRRLPDRVLLQVHGPDGDHRPVHGPGGRVPAGRRDRQPAAPHARLPPQGADRHGRAVRRPVRGSDRQLQRHRGKPGRHPRVAGRRRRGRQRPLRDLQQPGRRERAADREHDRRRPRGRPGHRRERRAVEHRRAGRERDQRRPRRVRQAEGLPLPRESSAPASRRRRRARACRTSSTRRRTSSARRSR